MTTVTRRCYRCRETLLLTAFSRDRSSTDTAHQRRYICKSCANLTRKLWRARLTPEQREEQRRKHRECERHLERARSRRHTREDNIGTLLMMVDRLMSWGLSQGEIARRSGVAPNTLSRWRNRRTTGRHINSDTVKKVMTVYLAVIDARRMTNQEATR